MKILLFVILGLNIICLITGVLKVYFLARKK